MEDFMTQYLRGIYILLVLLIGTTQAKAQFAPAAGLPGSTAIHKDDPAIIAWAFSCDLQVGWINIQDSTQGKVIDDGCQASLGPAGEGGLVSLGDGGSITLYFDEAIVDRDGFDFAVFENSFNDTYLELAHVEVSSDGIHFVRFPSTSLSDTSQQIGAFGAVDPTHIHNLAGKYRANYGTPFDLAELVDSSINIHHITHIRLIDVVGSISSNFGTKDQFGHFINDPFPTPFPSSGFDLDAIGILNNETNSTVDINNISAIYPNPVQRGQMLHLNTDKKINSIRLYNTLGQCLMEGNMTHFYIDQSLNKGIYLIKIHTSTSTWIKKIKII